MKPGKVLCCILLLAILGNDPAQKLAKLTNEQKHCDYAIYAQSTDEQRAKNIEGRGPSYINLCLFIYIDLYLLF